MPANSIEVARYMSADRFTPGWFAETSKLSPVEQVSKLVQYINPITGKLYSSFQCDEWEAGGVNFSKLTADPVEGDPHYEIWSNLKKHDRPLPDSWRLRVYGDEPGEVLLDTVVDFYTCEQWEEMQSN
jgi:hypothetical protein